MMTDTLDDDAGNSEPGRNTHPAGSDTQRLADLERELSALCKRYGMEKAVAVFIATPKLDAGTVIPIVLAPVVPWKATGIDLAYIGALLLKMAVR